MLPREGNVVIRKQISKRKENEFMRMKSDKPIFILYIVGFIVLALSVALFQPLADTPPLFGNPPDEHARYLVPLYICQTGKIPTGLEEAVRISGYGFSYGLYNVFPYIIQGYLMRVVDTFSNSEAALLYTARSVNVVFGICMAVVVYLISKRVFKDKRFRWLFCFATMYLPESIFLHTYVNTDSCCMLSTAMMVYALICCYQDGINRKNSIWMSGGIILCALSYYNAYGYILSCIVLFVAFFLQKKDGRWSYNWREMLKWGCFISAVVLLGISWWFIRSYIVLDGDMLGLATREKLSEMYGNEYVNPLLGLTFEAQGYTIWEMIREKNMFEAFLYGFVAAYGSMSILSGAWLYRLYKVFFGVGALGCVYYLLDRKARDKMNWKRVFFHCNMLFCILMPLMLTIYYAYTMDYQDQGRYLLPALVPFMAYVVKGVEKLLQFKWKRFVFPKWVVNVGVVACFLLIIVGTLDMIYMRALPVYLETGLVF